MTYAATLADIKKALAPMPTATLIHQARAFDRTVASKQAAIDVLADAVNRNQTALHRIQSVVASAAPTVPATPDPKVEAAAQVASRAEAVALDAKGLADRAAEQVVRLIPKTPKPLTKNSIFKNEITYN